jgi:hypothetical protein
MLTERKARQLYFFTLMLLALVLAGAVLVYLPGAASPLTIALLGLNVFALAGRAFLVIAYEWLRCAPRSAPGAPPWRTARV